MIFVSSACVRRDKIWESVEFLAKNEFKNIELSGGTKYYPAWEEDLFEVKEKYNLNFLVHNYFPPPERDFVLNLASIDKDIYRSSIEHLKKATAFSEKIGASKFGFHAGFYFDIPLNEIGKTISKSNLFDRKQAVQAFIDGFNELKAQTENINLYLENNVLSKNNYDSFSGENPFMLVEYQDYIELTNKIQFGFLLDVGHLKVSANSLNLDFEDELYNLIAHSDYIHLSDNDSLSDQNLCFTENSRTLALLKQYDWSNKTVSLEMYEPIEKIKQNYELIAESFNIET